MIFSESANYRQLIEPILTNSRVNQFLNNVVKNYPVSLEIV